MLTLASHDGVFIVQKFNTHIHKFIPIVTMNNETFIIPLDVFGLVIHLFTFPYIQMSYY